MALAPDTLSVQDATGTTQAIPVNTDAAGNLTRVMTTEQIGVDTYSFAGSMTAAGMAATPTDVVVLRGSATRAVRPRRIAVHGTATADNLRLVILKKHTFANTSGTTAANTPALHDSAGTAATALLLSYTSNPTISSSAIAIRNEYLGETIATTAASPQKVVWTFGDHNDNGLVLRGVAQELALNLNGVATAAGEVLTYSFEWTEDDS